MTFNSSLDPDYPLVIRVRSGDSLAFEALVEKYQHSITNLAARILRDFHEAHDIAQTVFVQAYRALADFEFACKLSTWLHTITRNLCLNELRRRSRHRCRSLDESGNESETYDIEDARAWPAFEAVFHSELNERLEQALGSLPEPQRTAILLCRDGRMSYEEIAAVLHLSVSATKSLLHRGRRALKLKLRPYLRIEECPALRKPFPPQGRTERPLIHEDAIC